MAEETTNEMIAEEAAPAVSDKADKPAKSAKKNDKKKPSFFERVKKFFRDYKSEFKKIVWPSFSQNTKTTVVVTIVIVITAIIVGVLDLVFNKGILWLGTLV